MNFFRSAVVVGQPRIQLAVEILDTRIPRTDADRKQPVQPVDGGKQADRRVDDDHAVNPELALRGIDRFHHRRIRRPEAEAQHVDVGNPDSARQVRDDLLHRTVQVAAILAQIPRHPGARCRHDEAGNVGDGRLRTWYPAPYSAARNMEIFAVLPSLPVPEMRIASGAGLSCSANQARKRRLNQKISGAGATQGSAILISCSGTTSGTGARSCGRGP